MIKSSKKQTVDRQSSVPLYKQIKQILIDELRTADGESGRPFSTEYELVERFHVSRAPVRQALKELADEGYVYRERAKGTFPVQALPVRPSGLELGGLVGYLREQGIDCHSKILAVEHERPFKRLSEILGLDDAETVLKISRLIMLTNRPLVWTQTYLRVAKDFLPTSKELEEATSVFSLLEHERGIFISRGEHQIYASGASAEEAEILGICEGNPILVIETKLFTRNDRLIGSRRAIHKADEYKFSLTVNR